MNMATGWNECKEMADENRGNGLFVRLQNDGDSAVGAFCGEPYAREVVWNGKGYDDYDPDNPDHTKKSMRVAINFFDADEKSMKIAEGTPKFFDTLMEVHEKYGFDQWLFEYKRRGAKGDPKTTYSLLPDKQIDEDLAIRIAKWELHDLAQAVRGEEAESADKHPIGEDVARGLVEKLKRHSRATVDEFLHKFGVTRVRDLPRCDAEHARAWLAEAEARLSPPAEVDPFA